MLDQVHGRPEAYEINYITFYAFNGHYAVPFGLPILMTGNHVGGERRAGGPLGPGLDRVGGRADVSGGRAGGRLSVQWLRSRAGHCRR